MDQQRERDEREYLLQRGWPTTRVEQMSVEHLQDVCSLERLIEKLQSDALANEDAGRESAFVDLIDATVTLADFAGHDADCESLAHGGCSCGYDEARRRFERARRQAG